MNITESKPLKRFLAVPLTTVEKVEYGRKLAHLHQEYGEVELDKKAAADRFKEQLDSLDSQSGHGKASADPNCPPRLEAIDPGAASIVERFVEFADNLPTDVEAYATFNSQIQAVILSLEKTNPRTAFQLAQLKLKTNQKLYSAMRAFGH